MCSSSSSSSTQALQQQRVCARVCILCFYTTVCARAHTHTHTHAETHTHTRHPMRLAQHTSARSKARDLTAVLKHCSNRIKSTYVICEALTLGCAKPHIISNACTFQTHTQQQNKECICETHTLGCAKPHIISNACTFQTHTHQQIEECIYVRLTH